LPIAPLPWFPFPQAEVAPVLPARGRRGQFRHGSAGALLSDGEVELCREIQPELRAYPEPVPKPQRGIAGYGTLGGDDLAYPVGRHIYLTGECRRAHANLGQLVSQNLARVNDALQHAHVSPHPVIR
jgi:hypothetical protein